MKNFHGDVKMYKSGVISIKFMEIRQPKIEFRIIIHIPMLFRNLKNHFPSETNMYESGM